MLFNSYIYILIFLPLCTIVYFQLNRKKYTTGAKYWLVGCSLFFYSFWNPVYLPIILLSMLVNFSIGSSFAERRNLKNPKFVLALGISFNVLLLGYFKYADFFISNFNWISGSSYNLVHLVLPLAISFFTFQQIAYLVDSYKGETNEYDFINYCLFVTFFPQLIAGPIVHHKEMMPQFSRLKDKIFNWKNCYQGILIFIIGLSKKVIIADSLSPFVESGFSYPLPLPFVEAWMVTLAYSLQIYFDFSGYTDMAIGSALLFNIKLPINFNSPYKALSIQEFWKRWHMTLSRWLKDYIYIPLGGSRVSNLLTYRNLFLTFLIGGFWHGAGWTFIIWGALHGLACCTHKLWQGLNFKLPSLLSWFLTFLFINFTWIFFRAPNIDTALSVLKGTLGFNGVTLPQQLSSLTFLERVGVSFELNWLHEIYHSTPAVILFVTIPMLMALFCINSNRLKPHLKPNYAVLTLAVGVGLYSLLSLSKVSEFLYFQF